MKVCTWCGITTDNQQDLFCKVCGKELENCIHCGCGHEILPTDKFCPKCGLKRTAKFTFEINQEEQRRAIEIRDAKRSKQSNKIMLMLFAFMISSASATAMIVILINYNVYLTSFTIWIKFIGIIIFFILSTLAAVFSAIKLSRLEKEWWDIK